MKNKKEKNRKGKAKKGELSTGTIVTVIILILSFLLILILWRSFYWNPIINEEACHQSIVFRSSVNFGLIKSSKVVPLKCQTEKICLTMSKQDCLQVGKNTNDNPVQKIELDKDPIKARLQVLDVMAEEMRQCHSMLGEGKLQFMPEGFFDKASTAAFNGNPNDLGNKNYCLICSRVVLDTEARQKIGDITYSELYLELAKKTTNGKQTYLEYIYPDWKDWRNSYALFEALKKDNEANAQKYGGNAISQMKFEDWKMNMKDEGGFAIIASMTTKDYWPVLTGTAAAVVGTGLIATGIGAPFGVALIGTTAVGGAVFYYNSPTGDFKYGAPRIEPYNLERLQNMQCDSFETAP